MTRQYEKMVAVGLSGWRLSSDAGGCNFCDSRADVKELRGRGRCLVVRLCRNCIHELKDALRGTP